jgi:hypothetical protein
MIDFEAISGIAEVAAGEFEGAGVAAAAGAAAGLGGAPAAAAGASFLASARGFPVDDFSVGGMAAAIVVTGAMTGAGSGVVFCATGSGAAVCATGGEAGAAGGTGGAAAVALCLAIAPVADSSPCSRVVKREYMRSRSPLSVSIADASRRVSF